MSIESSIGIIGGSGVYNIDSIKRVKEHIVETPYGNPSACILEGEIEGNRFFFIPRHGKKHNILPHEINYRANIFALKSLGVKYVLSVTAVGSLKEEYPPRTFVLPDQFIDWTKGKRERSFFGKGIVGHVSTACPINLELQSLIAKSCEEQKINYAKGGTYICIEGPQYSSKAESFLYKSFGATVIGMTNVPESYLAKEAGMAYATVAMVTDFDCWKDEDCNVKDIMRVMEDNNISVQKLILDVIPKLAKRPFEFKAEIKDAIMTQYEDLDSDQKKIVDILIK